MICRHSAGDPGCGSYSGPSQKDLDDLTRRYEKHLNELRSTVVNPDEFLVEKFARVGDGVVMMVRYPSCSRCAYEGRKVLFFKKLPESMSFGVKRIDPHFRDPSEKLPPGCAPSPDARFPGSEEGFREAVTWARYVTEVKPAWDGPA